MNPLRADMCRRCGTEMESYELCELCNMTLKLICPKCKNTTGDLMHYHSMN